MDEYQSDITEAFQRFANAVQEFAEALIEALRPFVAAVIDACKQLYDAVRAAYSAVGMPYGDSDEGMWRWLTEIRFVNYLYLEAARIENHHLALAGLRLYRT